MSNETAVRELPRHRPATDIIEQEDGFHILMDLPGVTREALHIDLNENELTLSAKTGYPANPGEESAEKYAHMEFGGAEYRRTFTLSDTVDQSRIEATLNDGALNLFLPKSEKSQPRRIEITAG